MFLVMHLQYNFFVMKLEYRQDDFFVVPTQIHLYADWTIQTQEHEMQHA